jgi:aminoglycoside 3-N-acetyltransferase
VSDPPIVTKSRLIHDLRNLGVSPGQLIMLHASVKAIGWVVGGPDVVLQSLFDILTPNGTLMMLASWEDGTYEMGEWPEAKQRAYLEESPPFDPDRSRAYRGWGILTEYLRTWPGARRSANPDGSFAAVGSLAKWITEDHALQYGLGPHSPLAKLCEAKGKVLVLGSSLHDVTLLHHSEHMAKVPHKPIVRYKVPIVDNDQRKWIEIEEFDTNKRIGNWKGEDYFNLITKEALKSRIGCTGQVGGAESFLFDAYALNQFAIQWLEANLENQPT